MKKQISILFIYLCSGLLVSGQQPLFFGNKLPGISFTSASDWQSVDNTATGTLELVNQNHNLQLKMWYESTGMSARDYLAELMDREGLVAAIEPFTTLVDHHIATGVIAGCSEMRRPVKVLLFAVQNSNGFYVLRFKCPDECFPEHRYQMQELISSVIIMNNRESFLYYAEQSRNS